jgi:hypothetical protein
MKWVIIRLMFIFLFTIIYIVYTIFVKMQHCCCKITIEGGG